MRKEQNAIDLKVKGKKGVEEAMARIEDVAASINGTRRSRARTRTEARLCPAETWVVDKVAGQS